MTRTALALAALVAAVPALAQTAPPTAADSALVENVVDALRVADFSDDLLGLGWRDNVVHRGGTDPAPAVADSLRALLLADIRPALLREARSYLSGPDYAQFLDQSLAYAERRAELDVADLLSEQRVRSSGDSLADAVLSRRLVLARRQEDVLPDLMRRSLLGAAQAVPEDAARTEAEAGVEARARAFQVWTGDLTPVAIAGTRAAMYGLPGGVLAETVRFFESPAGRYIQDAGAEATLRVAVPPMAEMMAMSHQGMLDMEHRAAPPPFARVYDVAEVMPELIGGLDGLMGRVVYPEAAQEAGVEGQVVVRFVVDAGGAVTDPEVLRSPDPRLSEAALDAVRASRFTPGRVGGEPVRVRFALPVVFRLAADVPGGAGAAEGAQGEGRGGDLVGGDFVVHDLDLVYPDDARREGVAGTVVVSLAVDAEGRAVDPVVTASPDDRLSSAALDALRGARFSPAPTAGRVEVPVTFAIDPPAAPPAGGEVSETFETPPVLIGGMPWLTGNVEYPESARRAGVQGQVVVRFVVGETGEIRDVRVASSPDPRLSQAALQAVHAARFRPATRDGRPVAVEFAVPVTFRVR